MQSFRNRAQAAIDYLMTHGWALMVVMVIGFLFWQWGFLLGAPEGMSSFGFTYFRFLQASSSSHGGHTLLSFINEMPHTIFFDEEKSEMREKISNNDCEPVFFPNPVGPNEPFTISSDDCVPYDQKYYELEVKIRYAYTSAGTRVQRDEGGEIKGTQTPTETSTQEEIDCRDICKEQAAGRWLAHYYESNDCRTISSGQEGELVISGDCCCYYGRGNICPKEYHLCEFISSHNRLIKCCPDECDEVSDDDSCELVLRLD
jgi:hypothetical protein